jgi:hypothetical protein
MERRSMAGDRVANKLEISVYIQVVVAGLVPAMAAKAQLGNIIRGSATAAWMDLLARMPVH